LKVLWTFEAYKQAKLKIGEELYRNRKPRPYDPTEPTEMDPRGMLDLEYMKRLKALDERAMSEGIHPYWRILRVLKEWMWRRAWAEAKEEVAEDHPDWARQWPELFR
jgi:hypothetical protein